jgi:hypothetical protein
MPLKSQAQSRAMHAADQDPAVAAKLGIPQKVAHEFVESSHGQRVRDLPERLGKSDGGAVRGPKRFRW